MIHQRARTQSRVACGRFDIMRDAGTYDQSLVTCVDCLRVLRDPEKHGLPLSAISPQRSLPWSDPASDPIGDVLMARSAGRLQHEGNRDEIRRLNRRLQREIRGAWWERLRSQLFRRTPVRENAKDPK